MTELFRYKNIQHIKPDGEKTEYKEIRIRYPNPKLSIEGVNFLKRLKGLLVAGGIFVKFSVLFDYFD